MKLLLCFFLLSGYSFVNPDLVKDDEEHDLTVTAKSVDAALRYLGDSNRRTITRSDELTINLKDFYFATERPGNYLVKLLVKFSGYNYSEDGHNGHSFNDTEEIILKDLIVISKDNHMAKLDARQIIGYKRLEDIDKLSLELQLIELNETQFNDFNKIISGVVESVVPLPIIENLLFNGKKDYANNSVTTKAEFYIPGNFIQFKSLENEDHALLEEGKTIEIAIIDDKMPRLKQGNVLSFFKEKLNDTSSLLYGDKILKDKKEDITGILRIEVNTKAEKPLPPAIVKDLHSIIKKVYDTRISDPEFSSEIKRIEDYVAKFSDSNFINSRQAASIIHFTDLAKIKHRYLLGENRLACIQSFVHWHCYEINNHIHHDFAKLLVEQIYDSQLVRGVKGNNQSVEHTYASILMPYSIDDKLLTSSVRWQIDLHKVLREEIKEIEELGDDLADTQKTFFDIIKLKFDEITTIKEV